MIVSAAKSEANRRNAAKSTGPKTAEGKGRSRRNGLKHGLTGSGVVLPNEDEAKVSGLYDELDRELAPASGMGRILVHRIATLAIRLERCARQESASLAEQVRRSGFEFDEDRQDEAEVLLLDLKENPAGRVRRLKETPEGLAKLIGAWRTLRRTLPRMAGSCWSRDECERAENLAGKEAFPKSGTRIEALIRAVHGDCSGLAPVDGEGLDPNGRRAWARERMVELIDGEIDGLRALEASIDPEAIARERLEAADRALFDPSKDATLARKYEAAAERGLYKALRELRQVEAEAADRGDSGANAENQGACDAVASSLPEDGGEKAVDEPTPSPRPARVGTRSPEPSGVGSRGVARSESPGRPVEAAA